MGSELKMEWLCRGCGQRHSALPLSGSVKAPLAITAIPLSERDERIVITADQCVIDGRDHFLRGRIAIPIHGQQEPFIWGVWAKVGARDFLRTNHLWKTVGRESEPPYKGLLNSSLPMYGATVNLQLTISTRPVGQRPHFTVDDPLHPLALDQRNGITLERVMEIESALLHT